MKKTVLIVMACLSISPLAVSAGSDVVDIAMEISISECGGNQPCIGERVTNLLEELKSIAQMRCERRGYNRIHVSKVSRKTLNPATIRMTVQALCKN